MPGALIGRGAARRSAALLALAALLLIARSAAATENCGQFGGFCRAQAAQQTIVVGVQQGISSLPPTSGQSYSWSYDPALDTYLRSSFLGPMSFRTPETVGKGRVSLRLATTYFDLSSTFDPITYERTRPGSANSYVKLGTSVDAEVGLINIAVNYGITNDFEVTANLPLVIVDASANNLFSARPGSDEVASRATPEGLDAALHSSGPDRLVIGHQPFNRSDAGFRFDNGTHVGVGRIDVGVKGRLYSGHGFELGPQLEFFCPSPDQDQFSGTDTEALLGRMIGAYALSEQAHLHLDLGYDYDFQLAELRRFVWNAGASYAFHGGVVDAGFGGSEFDRGIEWTPKFATAVSTPGGNADSTLRALGNTRLGTNYVDFLGGVKFEVAENTVLGGTVTVPVTQDGLRPIAVGTIGLEYYF